MSYNPVKSVASRSGDVVIAESDVTNLTTDLAAKAPLASPALTGTPTAPTATANTNSTQISSTAYVDRMGPIGVGVVGFRDDFMSFSGGGSITTANALTSDTNWIDIQIVGGTQSVSQSTDATFTNPGNVKITTSATSGQGFAMFKGNSAGGSAQVGALGSNSGWELHIIVKLGQTTSCCLRIGAAKSGQAASDAPTDGIYFEYDTANTGNTDTKFTGVTRSGSTSAYINTHSIAADTSFHHFRIRSTVSGTIGFTVDGGTEDTTTTDVTSAVLTPFLQLLTRTSSTANATIDYFSYIAVISRT